MTFGIRGNLLLGHGAGVRVGKNYSWMESDLSQREATIGLCLTYTMLGFDLGYIGLL